MATRLYEHQKAAIEKLHTGAILVGGVGSGKSLTALGYVFSKVRGGKNPIIGDSGYSPMKVDKELYVITTARKRDSADWQKEAAIFGLNPIVDSWNNIAKYISVKNAFFLFDEQRLVGSGAWVKSFYKIVANNGWILLSATPGDTWLDYIPVMVANGFYKNRTEFLRRHVVFNHFSKFPKVDHYVEVQRLVKIRNAILVNMHFVRKTIRNEIDVICEYDREKTRRLMIDRWNIYEDVPVKDISELCRLLRQLANSDPSRLVKLGEIIVKHPKVIIFYNFNFELAILEQFAKDNDIPYTQWNGHKHEDLLRDKPCWLYLCQYTAASEAWNAIETDTIVFFSQNYSYKIMEQASGRIDRMNTPFEMLYYYHFISHSPIDLAIRKALIQKQTFNESRFQNY